VSGYTVTRLLGSGGFADVYLYSQSLPQRNVAIKVLIPDAADDEMIAGFMAEANLMAALSTHPAIVTIYQAGIASDGRPYLVMEYCSRPNLAARYRAERLSVAEVLRIGVHIAGAVETAHRAGILHRDIKPANVLTTDFGHPVLSDFGISVSRGSAQAVANVGMSIPWTAPEMFTEGVDGDERADIYSLAATLYTALARRSPFDRPGGPNRSADLIGRIRTAPLPALGRSDVPPSLERLLIRAMDKNPAARQSSALDFARGLQRVETELRLAPTPVDVLAEHPDDIAAHDEEGMATRVRSLTVIDPAAGPLGPTRSAMLTRGGYAPPPGPQRGLQPDPIALPAAATGDPSAATSQVTRQGISGASTQDPTTAGSFPPDGNRTAALAESDTVRRESTEVAPGGPVQGRSRVPLLVGGGLLVAVVALVTTLLLTRGGSTPVPPDHSGDTLATMTSQIDPIGGAVPLPADLTGQPITDGVIFHWRNPDPRPGDEFQWYRDTDTAGRHLTAETTVTLHGSGVICIYVVLVRSDGTSSPQPATSCVKAAKATS
jgi:serine/threonine protein kinase